MKRLSVALLLAVVVAGAAHAGTTIVLNGGAPNVISYNGQTAYEYVYDIYGQPYLNVALTGFDATALLNLYNGQLYDFWDSWSAGYNGGFSGWGMTAGPYPSYYDNAVDDWAIDPSAGAQSTYGYAYDPTYAASHGTLNTWHLASEYDGASIHAYNPGTVNASELGGEPGVHFWYGIQSGWADDSDLYMTIRLVHPEGPFGEITYRPDGGDTMTVVGPGPGGNRPGDFDSDGDIDADDIDMLRDAIHAGSTDPTLDLNGDGQLDCEDFAFLIHNLVDTTLGEGTGTEFGDFNLDGLVGILDLGILGDNYNTPGGWAQGNANCADDNVGILDLGLLGDNYGYDGSAIPEPTTLSLLGIGAVAILKRRRS